jgi:hypothetical protein
VVDTTEEWLVAVSNSPTQLQDPHVWHLHTNPFVVVGQGRWDYRHGVQSHERVEANGAYNCATKSRSHMGGTLQDFRFSDNTHARRCKQARKT